MFKFIPRILMNEADLLDGGAGGGSATGTGDDLSGSGTPGGDQGGTGGSSAPEWLSGVDSALASDPSMGNIKNLDGLVKSYIHAQKLVGSDKMVIPNENTSPEDWKKTFNTLGLPESKENYKISKAENSKLDDKFHQSLADKAFELNILPAQAQGIADFYEEMITGAESTHLEKMQQMQDSSISNLKEEWGEGFQRKVAAANYAIDNFGGEDLRGHLKKIGLSNDPTLVKLFSNIGEQMSEDDFASSDTAGFGNTPDQALEKMNNMLSDSSSPLNNPSHANHKLAQEEYNKLAKQLSPKRK